MSSPFKEIKNLAANHSSDRMEELNKHETKQRMLVGIKIK
jgi:hypothetical protein